jgi:hypothetical protein
MRPGGVARDSCQADMGQDLKDRAGEQMHAGIFEKGFL